MLPGCLPIVTSLPLRLLRLKSDGVDEIPKAHDVFPDVPGEIGWRAGFGFDALAFELIRQLRRIQHRVYLCIEALNDCGGRSARHDQ